MGVARLWLGTMRKSGYTTIVLIVGDAIKYTRLGMSALTVAGRMCRQYSSASIEVILFKSYPKPKKKRKGRAVRRNKTVAQMARDRDGTCLYGLLYQDGCVGMLSPHHIVSFGSDPRQDVLENLIVLCKKHHNEAEAHTIDSITLRGILYHFYGYGPEEHDLVVLDDMRKQAAEYGLTSVFTMNKDMVQIVCVGFVSRFSHMFSWESMAQPDFMETFGTQLAFSQRKTNG